MLILCLSIHRSELCSPKYIFGRSTRIHKSNRTAHFILTAFPHKEPNIGQFSQVLKLSSQGQILCGLPELRRKHNSVRIIELLSNVTPILLIYISNCTADFIYRL